MNDKCFQFFLLETEVRGFDGVVQSVSCLMQLHPDGENEVGALLGKWGLTTDRFFMGLDAVLRKQGVWPWAIALYEKEFRLAGHVVSLRDQRADFSFTAYSLRNKQPYSIEERGVPPVSVLLLNSKTVIEKAAKRSVLFEQAWHLLKDKDEDDHWVCMPSSPLDDWVEKTGQGDDALFLKLVGKEQGKPAT